MPRQSSKVTLNAIVSTMLAPIDTDAFLYQRHIIKV